MQTKEQRSASALRRYRKRRALMVALLGGECVVCGTEKNLEFDHIDPKEKKFCITSMWSISKKRLFAELKKCQLLCKLHHKMKTASDNPSLSHGTWGMVKKGCKCGDCRAKVRNYSRQRRLSGVG